MPNSNQNWWFWVEKFVYLSQNWKHSSKNLWISVSNFLLTVQNAHFRSFYYEKWRFLSKIFREILDFKSKILIPHFNLGTFTIYDRWGSFGIKFDLSKLKSRYVNISKWILKTILRILIPVNLLAATLNNPKQLSTLNIFFKNARNW